MHDLYSNHRKGAVTADRTIKDLRIRDRLLLLPMASRLRLTTLLLPVVSHSYDARRTSSPGGRYSFCAQPTHDSPRSRGMNVSEAASSQRATTPRSMHNAQSAAARLPCGARSGSVSQFRAVIIHRCVDLPNWVAVHISLINPASCESICTKCMGGLRELRFIIAAAQHITGPNR